MDILNNIIKIHISRVDAKDILVVSSNPVRLGKPT